MFMAYGCAGRFVSYMRSLLISDGLNEVGVSPHTYIPTIKSKGSSSTSIDVGYFTGCCFDDPLGLSCPISMDVLCGVELTLGGIVLRSLSGRGIPCSGDTPFLDSPSESDA